MAEPGALWRRMTSYAADGDPLTAASNRLALILTSNQPFFPFYVFWVTGETSPLLALTFLSTPFFLASPWIAKRFPGVGRLWFPAVGAINTFFCAAIFGVASGVELFLAPCLVIAALSCRATERRALSAYVAILVGTFILLHGRYGTPLFLADPDQLVALRNLNAYSAAILSVIAIWMLAGPRFEQLPVTR
jgi:hypothetical protein